MATDFCPEDLVRALASKATRRLGGWHRKANYATSRVLRVGQDYWNPVTQGLGT